MEIACLLITHFPMKAELRRHTQFKGKPVIIVEESDSRQTVLDSSPGARGATAGMTLQEALSRCKEAALLEADLPYYEATFDDILSSLEQRSPLVEKAELGCAYIGLDGLAEMYGGRTRLVASLFQAAPEDFNPRIGVAEGKFPAYIAALISSGGRTTQVPDDAGVFLQRFPVDLLPMPQENKARLHRFGLHTLGQIASLSVGSMQAQFGPEGARAWKLANGIDRTSLLPNRREEAVSEFLTFPSPSLSQNTILIGIETLLGRAFSRPQVKGRYVRSVILESQICRYPPWIRLFTFKEAVGSKDRAFFVIRSALESVTLPGPLEDLKLTLAGLSGESGAQAGLFSDSRKQDQLREVVRQLRLRLGDKPPIYQVRDIEPCSRIPERRQALIPFDP